MSEIADALVVTAYGCKVAQMAPSSISSDIEQELWYVERPEKYDVSSKEVESAYNQYALISLGSIAAAQYFDNMTTLSHQNLRVEEFKLRFARLLPELRRPITREQIGRLSVSIEAAELGLPRMMILPILRIPSLRDELLEKWGIAKGVYAQRAIPLVPDDDRYDVDFYKYNSDIEGVLDSAWSDLALIAEKIRK